MESARAPRDTDRSSANLASSQIELRVSGPLRRKPRKECQHDGRADRGGERFTNFDPSGDEDCPRSR